MLLKKRFLEAANKYPDNLAVWTKEKSINYSELYKCAAQIAAALHGAGLMPGSLCALLGMRTVNCFGGIWGILLAGCGYVPTNPHFPAERNQEILINSMVTHAFLDYSQAEDYAVTLQSTEGLTVILESPNKANELKEKYPQHKFIAVNEDSPCDISVIPDAKTEDAAYLIFTSGSTGTPKGVTITNANVCHYIDAVRERYPYNSQDRFILLADLTFDLSVASIFPALTSGASLYVADKASLMAPANIIKEHDITYWVSVPTTAVIMKQLRLVHDGAFPSLRYSLFCGEALKADTAHSWQKATSNGIVENLYGPTEATMAFTAYRWQNDKSEQESENGIVPIGFPFKGLSIAIIDDDLNLVNYGEKGELLLEGAQLSPGYFNDAKITAEKFINLDLGFGVKRYYRTGDIVKETPHSLIFLGRADSQVKIRGYRVELSEIEGVIQEYCKLSSVLAVPVHLKESECNIAFFFLESEADTSKIRSAFLEKLPLYMLPDKIVAIKKFPLNNSGKIDRKIILQMAKELYSNE